MNIDASDRPHIIYYNYSGGITKHAMGTSATAVTDLEIVSGVQLHAVRSLVANMWRRPVIWQAASTWCDCEPMEKPVPANWWFWPENVNPGIGITTSCTCGEATLRRFCV
jgi:hypothetical protein